jgi:hypothetical protein
MGSLIETHAVRGYEWTVPCAAATRRRLQPREGLAFWRALTDGAQAEQVIREALP